MIFYNFRYRGPYEYDKYVLNVLQYSNMVNDFINDIDNTATWKTLKEDSLLLPTLLILIISPVIVSFFTRRKYLRKREAEESRLNI